MPRTNEMNSLTMESRYITCLKKHTNLMSFRDNQEIRRNNKIFDWDALTKRFESNISPLEEDRFKDATFVSTRWVEVRAINLEKLRSLNAPVAKITAVHTGGNEAKQANSEIAHGLEAELLLARGSRIM